MLAHCSPSSEWVPGGNTKETKTVRKGTGHPTSHANGPGQVSSLTGTLLKVVPYEVCGTTLSAQLRKKLGKLNTRIQNSN